MKNLAHRLRHCAAIVLLAPALALSGTLSLGTQAGGYYTVRVTTLKEARFRQTVRQQEDFSCGSAALATLLTYHYRRPISEREVLEAMYAAGDQQKIRREGFSLLDMKLYLESRGFQADGFHAPLDKLISTGTPAIVLVNESGYNHFVVLKGLVANEVLLGDPALGARVVQRSAFEASWVNKLVFVIHGEDVAGQFNAASDWRVRPRAPLGDAVSRESLAVSLVRPGRKDF